MSSTPASIQPTATASASVQATASASASATGAGAGAGARAAASAKPRVSDYAVGSIPAFKNYAAAASKSKPSPPAVNGKVDVTATITPSGSSLAAISPVAVAAPALAQPMSAAAPPTAGHSRKESVKVDGVQVPPSRVSAIRGAADSTVAFGNVNDKNAILSSSPANPPAVNGNGKPQAFGALPTAPKAPLNLHSFFGAAPSQSPAGSTPPAGRPAFDSRSSQSSMSSLPPNPSHAPSQLSSSSQSFAPRGIPPPFIPQQQQHQGFPSPQAQYAPYPAPGSSPYQQHAKPPPQNIPSGSPYGGPGGPGQQQNAQGGPQQRNGSFSNSPVMQHRGPGGLPGTSNRNQFGGPTSPRLGGAGLPQQPMMYSQQQWQPQGYPGYPQPQPFYPGQQMQGYPLGPGPPGQYGPPMPGTSGPGTVPPSLIASGASTPSAGVRTPSLSGAPGVPPSPVPSPLSMNPLAAAAFTPGQPYSPQPQSATLPHHPAHYASHAPHASLGSSTPLRASGSPFSLSAVASAQEFKPSGDAPTFAPAQPLTPRKSQAIKIRNPKDAGVVVPPKKTASPAPSTPVLASAKTEDDKKADADAQAALAKATADAEAASAAATAKKAADDKLAADEAAKKADEERVAKDKADADAAAAAALAEQERVAAVEEAQKAADAAIAAEKELAAQKLVEDEAAAAAKVQADELAAEQKAAADADALAAKRVEELKAAASTVPSTAVEEVAPLKESEPEPVSQDVASEEMTVTEAAAALVEARESIELPASATPIPSSLPSKPTNGATAPPASDKARHVPDPLDLSATKAGDVPAPLPSALATARAITNLGDIAYPKDIKSPRSDLNATAEPGKYRYDREFLMQFMSVCVEKPEQLPNLEAIGMIDAGADASGGRGGNFAGSGGRRPSSMGPPAVPNRSHSTGGVGGFGGNRVGGIGGGFAMGNFSTQPGASSVGTTSEARFAQANIRAASGGGSSFGGAGGARGGMVRTSSQGGVGGGNFTPARTRSDRGRVRGGDGGGGGRSEGGGRGGGGKHTTGDGFEGATLDNHVEDRWMPSVLNAGGSSAADPTAPDSPELVQRKVKALLNKLTLEKFDSISDQILAWADKSVNETDGRILRQVIALIFEKATDEANFSEMYARLCRKLMEKVSPNVKDEGVKAPDGQLVAGGGLFRKYLLNRCQEDYESGWKAKEVSAVAAADKAADDNAKKEANDVAEKEAKDGVASASSSGPPKEAELLSDEYYAAEKAKRRGLGLVRFIGELYRLQMLTERIMHECIKKLLANTENPEEEDVESLCRLLTTVGKGLDNPKAKAHMDIYFSRMKLIADNMKISSRIRFMIQDVLELRLDRWQPRNIATGPKLLSEIHSDAQKAVEDSARRTASSGGKGMPRLQDQLSRPNSRRGQGRDQFGVPAVGPDGWSAPVPQRPAKAGDLSGFGKIREPSTAISLGPSGAFANRAAKAKEASRPAPGNMFSLLEAQDAAASTSSRPKLVLAPRSKPKDGEEGDEKAEDEVAEPEPEDDDDGAIDPNAVSMSRAEGERKAGNSVKEFFAVKSIAEGVASVELLPAEYRSFLISSLASAAMEKKADEVNITRQLFAELVAKSVVTHAHMLAALAVPIKTLIDVSVDAPSAYTFIAQLLAGAGISREETQELSLKMETEEEDEEEVERGQGLLLAAVDKIIAATATAAV